MSRGVLPAAALLIIAGILVALPTAHGAACHRFVGNWTQVASAPLHAWSGAACAVVNGSLYMTQGWAGLDGGGAQFPSNDTVSYDPLSDVWTVRAQAPLAAALTQAATDGRYIYVAGGFSGYWPTAFADVSRYDTQTDQWLALTPLPAARISGALVLVGSDLHYISGLSSETQMTADHLVLDLTNASAVWVTTAAFPDPKTHIMGSLLGDTIVVPGGQYGEEPSTTAQDQNTTQGFNVSSLTWSTLAPLPASRTLYASAVWDGRLVVAGGRNWTAAGYTVHTDVLEFALDENAWYAIGALPVQLLGACIGYFPEVTIGGVQGNFLVVSGGGVDWNLFGNSTWIIRVENLCPPVATSAPPAPSDGPTASPAATSDSTQTTGDSTQTSTTSLVPTVTVTGKVSSGNPGSTSSDSTSRGAATTGQIGGLTSGALRVSGAVALVAASAALMLA